MRLLIRPRRPVLSACTLAQRPLLVTRLPRRWLSTGSPACLCPTSTHPAPTREAAAQLKKLQSMKSKELPGTPCRTRFAPSPTGFLHLGSLRTALFNFLLAKATGGQFILRIEDTDQARTVPGAEERLYKDLKWAGLSWDEGPDVAGPYGPYRQSERLDLYHQHAKILLDNGKAYRCFCSPEVLLEHTKVALEQGSRTSYPGTCRSISQEESDDRASKGEPHAIRFRSPDKPARFVDVVYGVSRERDPPEEFVIMKRDGFPTYHFANVVDDKHMKITHVIRGAEWLISTPKHVALYEAFGWEPPEFAHVGLLVDEQRHKLSKRHAGVDISEYQANNTLPVALLNFCVLLGWSKAQKRGANSDVMTLQDMIDNFSLKFTRGDIKVDFGKLGFLQDKHILRATSSPEEIARQAGTLVEPIDKVFMAWEAERNENLKSDIPWQRALDTQSAPVPAMDTPDSTARELYIAQVLTVLTHHAIKDGNSTPEGFLTDYRYFFWGMPTSVLSKCKPLPKSKFEIPSSPGVAVGFQQVVDYLEDTLANVDKDKWANKDLTKVLSTTARNIRYHTAGDEEPAKSGPGFLILRRALIGVDRGPSVAQIMVLFGKEETMNRLRGLREVDWSSPMDAPEASNTTQDDLERRPLVEAIDRIFCDLKSDVARGGCLIWDRMTINLWWRWTPVSNMATEDRASRQRYIANAISTFGPTPPAGWKECVLMSFSGSAELTELERDAAVFLTAYTPLFFTPDYRWDPFHMSLLLESSFPGLSMELENLASGIKIDVSKALEIIEAELSTLGEGQWIADVLASVLSSAAQRLVWCAAEGVGSHKRASAVYDLLRGALWGSPSLAGSSEWIYGWDYVRHDRALSMTMALIGRKETMERVRAAQEAIWGHLEYKSLPSQREKGEHLEQESSD
ncbi:hypothetical protein QBC39DRAFT_315092 [Podospora conica]|nr:hypothetical protein QBC39DRAFT_315092 [Schizothecium conicum]